MISWPFQVSDLISPDISTAGMLQSDWLSENLLSVNVDTVEY